MEKQKEVPHYEFLPKLKIAKLFPIYFMYGTENYLKDSVLKAIIDKFKTEGSEEFDLNTFYGDDCSIVSVLEQLEMPPFMAKYQIVILKNFDKLKLKDKNLIANYSQNPAATSILILTADTNDQRLTANKKISKEALRITCKPPSRTDNIIGFLKNELKKKNIFMDTKALELFANSIELNYLIAANELEKLIIYTKNSGKITFDDVLECVGKSKINKIFDLQDSLGKKDLKTSLEIMGNMITNNIAGVYMITMLSRYFLQLWKILGLRKKNISDSEIKNRYMPEVFSTYRYKHINAANKFNLNEMRKIFSLFLQTDIDLKSLDPKLEKLLMERLVYQICRGM